MLNRFRDLVKRLELPEDEGDVVYRIIDDNFNTVEVSAAQYTNWRMQNDVTQMAIVGQDTVENIMVRTTFSIMPEDRSYKPFGTSAYEISSLDPRLEYSHRYDNWREAEQGHRNTLAQIRRDSAIARAAEQKAKDLAGAAGEVRLAISADLPAMFQITHRSESDVGVATPFLRADGTSIELTVSAGAAGFTLTSAVEALPDDVHPPLGKPRVEQVERLCKSLGVSVDGGLLVRKADDASELGRAIVNLTQAAACVSLLTSGRP